MDLPRPLRGLITPMATPLASTDKLDVAGLERLVPHLEAGGVHGLFLLGTTGEGPSLSYALRRELIQRVGKLRKAPMMVAITDTIREESLELARFAADQGAAAVVLAAPYYFPMSQADLLGYVERLADELPLPLYLYNMPSHTKVSFAPETVLRLADHAKIHGLKDSSGDLGYFHSLCEAMADRANFALLMGPEELLVEAMKLGAHGGVNGGSNLLPELFVGLYEAARDGRAEDAARLHARVVQIGRVYEAGGSYLKSLKCALGLAGLCSDVLAEPLQALDASHRARVRQALEDAGIKTALPVP